MSWVGYLCTCARADRASVSQERLGRLGSILVCELGVMNKALNTSHGWGISARAHVQTALLHLRIGLADCVQIWYVGWASLSTCFKQVMGGMGHLCTCALAPPPPPPTPPYLRIWLTNFVKIWCVNRDPMVTRFTKVGGGVTAHSHVRLQFRYLGNRSALTLKLHQKQTYLFRARSFIAKHGVLLVTSDV